MLPSASRCAQLARRLYVNEPGQSSLKDLVKQKGTPLNKVCSQTTHPELNNNDLNSLYVNEPGLYAIILGSNKPKRNALFD